MTDIHPFVAELETRARACEAAEAEFRRTMRDRVAELAQERAFANRRTNIVRSLIQTVDQAETREIAIAGAVAAMRRRLGWVDDAPARQEVLSRYAAVAHAAARRLPRQAGDEPDGNGPDDGAAPESELPEALADFEAWYIEARGRPFWVLFEHYMPETQLVDF